MSRYINANAGHANRQLHNKTVAIKTLEAYIAILKFFLADKTLQN
jgi:hypothetical protein